MSYKLVEDALKATSLKNLQIIARENGKSALGSKSQIISRLLDITEMTGGASFADLPVDIIREKFIYKLDYPDLRSLILSDPALAGKIQSDTGLREAYNIRKLINETNGYNLEQIVQTQNDLKNKINSNSILKKEYDERVKGFQRLLEWLLSIGLNFTQENLSKLQELSLSGRQLSHLPADIEQLSNLHDLSVSNNQLTQLPPEIGKLSNLRDLSLSYNYLSQLPDEIGQLTNLQNLWLYNNRLLLPPKIKTIQKLLPNTTLHF